MTEQERREHFAFLNGVAADMKESRKEIIDLLEDIKSELESDVMKFNKRPEISYDAAFSDGIEHALTIIDKHISEKENE